MSSDALTAAEKVDRDRWLAIELRHLAALAAVAQLESFSGAADSLGYVQSAVSQQISALERIVGHRLVDRSARPRSVALTDAGRTLLSHVDDILDLLRLAKADVDALNRHSEHAVDFGIDDLLGNWLAATVLGSLLPDSETESWGRVDRGPSTQLLQLVADGELDAAFVTMPIASGPFFALELTRLPCVLVVPSDVEPSQRSVDAILEQWPLVQIEGCPATRALLERRTPTSPRAGSLHTATGPASALPLVRAGAAVAVMTPMDVSDDDTVKTIAVPELPDRVAGMAWHRDRDDCPAVIGLRTIARRAWRELAPAPAMR
jgi:DNA-binding transcriptional LysR family regulator